MPAPFSERQGFMQPKGIRYRDELPYALRVPIIELARKRTGARWLRYLVSGVLDPYEIAANQPPESGPMARRSQGPVQFTPPLRTYDNPDLQAAHDNIAGCPWFRVYDVIEAIYQELLLPVQEGDRIVRDHAPQFETEINDYFCYAEIGWQLRNGLITTRGDDGFESTIIAALSILEKAQRPTAKGHIQSAITALSSRPTPNTSGAVSHATNALECVLGEVTGQTMTLGKYLDKYPNLFHPSLKKGLDHIYGYASDEGARHGKEGIEPERDDAEFVVAICAAVCTLLTQKHPK